MGEISSFPFAAEPESVSPEALRAAVSDEQARRFYESRGWRPAWTENGGALLSSALDGAEHRGLHRSMFLKAESETGTAAQREAALTRAAIAYAEALATGRTDPAKVRDLYTIARPEADVIPGLAKAVEAGNLAEWLVGLAPRGAGYRGCGALRASLIRRHRPISRSLR